MKHIAIAAALALPLAAAADTAPLKYDIYVRGAFNGWGTDNLLAYKGNGLYQVEILLSPGNHAFKIGSKDWNAEWVIDPSRTVSVAPGTSYAMDTHAGPEDYLFVKQTAVYRFSVDVSNTTVPKLAVMRVEQAQQGTAAADPHQGRSQVSTLAWPTWDGKEESARFSTPDPAAPLRTYAHSSTMQLRDPGPQYVNYSESGDLPQVRSGNLAFDALFALAGSEMKQDSVTQIRDGNYNGNAAIPCDCFETGEKWHYVWTRDLSYAATLGLALLDPQRVKNSLEFKLSGWRDGIAKAPQVAGSLDGLQIAQDTGSGGSWPVSTDRVTWAFAAEKLLQSLAPGERKAFAERALKALSNTIENDRLAAFDQATGLYTGEESFLDWRDQTYAAWITSDLASMATSKALSTNVGHYQALNLAARLAGEQGDATRARKYAVWARELKAAINKRLWLEDEGMYSSLTAAHFDGAPMHKFDWLGQALAIVTGVADGPRARRILASYPHGPMGAPVIWPQQQGMPVYHNRALWPFVTAYGLRAAALAGNVSVADAAYASLMRGAALNLSNMENLEWLSGQPLLLDEQHPDLIGPVINSKRQLWSVGAYLGMVIEGVFGVGLTDDGIELRPFVTARLRREAFAGTDRVVLNNLRLHGKRVDVTLLLPTVAPGEGYFAIDQVRLNGAQAGSMLKWDQLAESNSIEVTLGKLLPGQREIRRVNADPYVESDKVFGPREPGIKALAADHAGRAQLDIDAGGNGNGVFYNVYRDGKLVATHVPAGAWTDRTASRTACYAVEAQFADSGTRSHHSVPRCVDAGISIPVTDKRVVADALLAGPNTRFAEPHLAAWGKPSDTFKVNGVQVAQAGDYAIQVRYHNGANQVNLGISGGVKWLAVKDQAGRIVAQGVVQLPHARIEKSNTPTVYSTPLAARLKPGSYNLLMSDFYNMSYLQSNSSFSAAGGVEGPSNQFDIYGVRLVRVK
jgi:hypothetical protein